MDIDNLDENIKKINDEYNNERKEEKLYRKLRIGMTTALLLVSFIEGMVGKFTSLNSMSFFQQLIGNNYYLFSSIQFVFSCLFFAGTTIQIKKSKKRQNATFMQLKYLNKKKKTLQKEREKAKELTVEKDEIKDRNSTKEELENLKKQLELYYKYGYNEKRYDRYYDNGNLYKKLKYCNDNEISVIESEIENKNKLKKKIYNKKN